ncbi:DedA family protein [Paroceanicella profunda]|uniref:DedA family protein n=1 Tax=Paroceanicella profunda TaxID=2579971 RepID=A0A5B8FG73_9RHOB|nr:YqaA family protein [Paroceanicella profunda]QDL90777.1 DedA family protein [Paroceanicella profunda]
MLRALYDRVITLAGHRHALWFLAAISFVESSVFPIPPDVLLVPMIIARPRRAWLIAGVCTLASVLGGMLGYLIGSELFDLVGKPVLDFYGKGAQFREFAATFNEYGAWAVLVAGVTPFPYKVITIASGATGLNLAVFTLASIIARALRFFVIAALLWKFGPPVRDFIERRLGLVATVSVVLLFGGFLLVKLF